MTLAKLPHYTNRAIIEATGKNLYQNFNREGDYKISPA
jgi:hypothetical protein